jgi:hypothetical protein
LPFRSLSGRAKGKSAILRVLPEDKLTRERYEAILSTYWREAHRLDGITVGSLGSASNLLVSLFCRLLSLAQPCLAEEIGI